MKKWIIVLLALLVAGGVAWTIWGRKLISTPVPAPVVPAVEEKKETPKDATAPKAEVPVKK